MREKIDLAILYERTSSIEERLKKIEENHLPHIEDRINSLEKRLAYYSGGVVVAVAILDIIIRLAR